jgi:hypothetical protein
MCDLSARAGVFPLPQIANPIPPASASRRLWQRYNIAAAVTECANSSITALNHLCISFSSNGSYSQRQQFLSQSEKSGARNHDNNNPEPTSTAQSRLLAHVYRCATRTVSRRGSIESECDDPLFDTNFLSTHLRDADLDAYISKPNATVVPVVADRVSLPAGDGAVDLMSLLPTAVAAKYADPSTLLRPVEDRKKRAPRTKLCGTQEEWIGQCSSTGFRDKNAGGRIDKSLKKVEVKNKRRKRRNRFSWSSSVTN